METPTHRILSKRDTATLVAYWNEQGGSLSWLIALEEELKSRGITPRGDDGRPRALKPDGSPTGYCRGERI